MNEKNIVSVTLDIPEELMELLVETAEINYDESYLQFIGQFEDLPEKEKYMIAFILGSKVMYSLMAQMKDIKIKPKPREIPTIEEFVDQIINKNKN